MIDPSIKKKKSA